MYLVPFFGKFRYIDIEEAQKIVDELEQSIKKGELPKNDELTISQTDFIRRNLVRFQTWGLPKRGIYKYLLNHGVQLGSYESFSRAWVICEKESQKFQVKEDGKAQKRDNAT